MANFNKVILAGNITRDPELSYTPANNTAVCKFGLAVNRTWTDRETNTKREETLFIDCTAWARRAETINQYLRKGRPILIEGRLVYDTWTTPEGQKRSKHSVVVENFSFIDAPGAGGGKGESAPAPATTAQSGTPPPGPDVPF